MQNKNLKIEQDFNKRVARAKSLLLLATAVILIAMAMMVIGLIQGDPIAAFYLGGFIITTFVIYRTMSDVEKSTFVETYRTLKILYGNDTEKIMEFFKIHKASVEEKENIEGEK